MRSAKGADDNFDRHEQVDSQEEGADLPSYHGIAALQEL